MDSLYHFILSLVGGYVFFTFSRRSFSPMLLVFVSLLSLITDTDHIVDRQFFHTIFFLIPPLLIFVYASLQHHSRLRIYSFLFALMVGGHLLADMMYGIGVRLLFPLSEEKFVLPRFFMEPNFISGFGFTLLCYFGAIFLAAYLLREKRT